MNDFLTKNPRSASYGNKEIHNVIKVLQTLT